MDSLPIEVLAHVFGNLGTRELLAVLQVCTKWRDVCSMVGNVTISFRYLVETQRPAHCKIPVSALAGVVGSFRSITVLDVSHCRELRWIKPMADILKGIGSNLESLSLAYTGTCLGGRMLQHITEHCGPKLQRLDLSGWCSPFYELHLEKRWKEFVVACPNVKELLISNCHGWENHIIMLLNNLKLEKLHCIAMTVKIPFTKTKCASRETMKELMVGNMQPSVGRDVDSAIADVFDFPNLESLGVYTQHSLTSILKSVRESNSGVLKRLYVGYGVKCCTLKEIEKMGSVRTLEMRAGGVHYNTDNVLAMLNKMPALEQFISCDNAIYRTVAKLHSKLVVTPAVFNGASALPNFMD
jgi:hypothetical protein